MKLLLLVFLGGGLGTLLRYSVTRWFMSIVNSSFPYSTFFINITGCFLIGFFVFMTERLGTNSMNWRLFLVTGFTGGYTTFSTFSFENVQLMSDHQLFTVFLYTLGSIAIGFAATYMGILVGRNI